MPVPQRQVQRQEIHDTNHLNVLRSVSDIFSAAVCYATQLAEIRYSQCTDDELAALEEKYGMNTGQVVTGLVREAATLVGIDLRGYRITKVEGMSFPETRSLVSFDDFIGKLE